MTGCGICPLQIATPQARREIQGLVSPIAKTSCIVGGSQRAFSLSRRHSYGKDGWRRRKPCLPIVSEKLARNFEAYLTKHRSRLVNYAYYQAEQLCSIGSGAVESAVKQIGRRLQISGARWYIASVNPMLNLRCAYLNGQLVF